MYEVVGQSESIDSRLGDRWGSLYAGSKAGQEHYREFVDIASP